MPFSVSQLSERVVRVDFTFDGDATFVEYRPSEFSDEGMATVRRIYGRQQEIGQIEPADDAERATLKAEVEALNKEGSEYIARMLAAWDLYEDDTYTEMIPLTQEKVEWASAHFSDYVMACIYAAMTHFSDVKARVGATSGRSVATSSRTAPTRNSKR